MRTTAAPLSLLSAGHVEVLLGSTVTAVPPGLLAYGAATVTAEDYTGAAPASSASGVTATAATAAKKAPSAASESGPAGHKSGATAAPKVEYGITSCVY